MTDFTDRLAAAFPALPVHSDLWFTVSGLAVMYDRPRFWPAFDVPTGGWSVDPELGGKTHNEGWAILLRSWLDHYRAGDSLFFLGMPGTGKTWLALRMLRYLVDLMTNPYWRPRYDVNIVGEVELLKGRRASGAIDDTTWEHQYRNIPLLFVDDLGTSKYSEATEVELFDLVDQRYGAQLSTIFTSNVPTTQLEEKLGTRISDRLMEMCHFVVLDGESVREPRTFVSQSVVGD